MNRRVTGRKKEAGAGHDGGLACSAKGEDPKSGSQAAAAVLPWVDVALARMTNLKAGAAENAARQVINCLWQPLHTLEETVGDFLADYEERMCATMWKKRRDGRLGCKIE